MTIEVSDTRPGVVNLARGLERDESGIWRTPGFSSVSYPASGHQDCFEVEDRSYWFSHRNRVISSAVERWPPPNQGTIVEIGGGNGVVSAALQRSGHRVALLEPGSDGAKNARRRGIETVICATLESAGFQQRSLDAVGLFDVIEHVKSDIRFAREVADILKPGGRLYVTVPAWPLLWSRQDEEAGHFRRYSKKSLDAVLTQAGFATEYFSYVFWPLPLPIFLFRSLPYRLGLARSSPSREETATDHGVDNSPGSRLLTRALRPEARRIEHGKALFFGSSCLLVARRNP